MQKLMRKERLEEQVQKAIERKKNKDEQKREEVDRKLRNILHGQKQKTQRWSEKLSRVSSRLGNSPNQNREKKMSRSVSREIVEGHEGKLKELHEKLDKSKGIHENYVREMSIRCANHNDVVHNRLRSQMSIREMTEENKLMKIVGKCDSLDIKRNKKQKMMHDANYKKQVKYKKNYLKFRENHEGVIEKVNNNTKRLENKNLLEKNILMCKAEEFKKEKEYQTLRKQFRDDDARENLERIRKDEAKKKIELLEKLLNSHKKFLKMKASKEKMNEKARIDAIQANQEYLKAKMIHLMINRSDNPHDVSPVIEKHF
jgi:hypothetical protein